MTAAETLARALHSVTFEAPDGRQQTHHCKTAGELRSVCFAMAARGFRRVAWIDRS